MKVEGLCDDNISDFMLFNLLNIKLMIQLALILEEWSLFALDNNQVTSDLKIQNILLNIFILIFTIVLTLLIFTNILIFSITELNRLSV